MHVQYPIHCPVPVPLQQRWHRKKLLTVSRKIIIYSELKKCPSKCLHIKEKLLKQFHIKYFRFFTWSCPLLVKGNSLTTYVCTGRHAQLLFTLLPRGVFWYFLFSENVLFIIDGIESVAINKTRESRLPIVNDVRSHDSGAINDRMEFSVICKSSLTLHYKRQVELQLFSLSDNAC